MSARDLIVDALASELGDTYDCTRAWSAWSYGTMGPDDFAPAAERAGEIADAILAALAANPPPAPSGKRTPWPDAL